MSRATLIQSLTQRLGLEKLSGMDHLPTTAKVSKTLADWQKEAQQCQNCALHKKRQHVVFGEGHPQADLLFVGEGPGAEEDRQGRPFVGPAGQLLTKIIKAIGLNREDVYIANVVKCRPPNNRPPEPNEAAQCRSYLEAQVRLIQPRVICALGRTAATALLNTDRALASLRGTTQNFLDVPVIVTYHPAHLLRHPEAKPAAWADVQRLIPYVR